MPLLTTDRRLLDAFREGEREALGRVYDNYAPAVAEFLRSGFGVQSKGDTVFFGGYRQAFELENAVQEVFARAFMPRARLSYDGLRPYVNYLFAIAKNLVVDDFRRRGAAGGRTQSLSDVAETLDLADADGAVDPAVAAEEKEVELLLASYLETCDERARRYYELRCRQGLTQDDVAAAMQLTRIQIRRVEAHFRKGLLGHLKEQGYLSQYRERRVGLLGASVLLVALVGVGHGL